MSFAAELQKACDRAKDRAVETVRLTALGVHAGMARRAPVGVYPAGSGKSGGRLKSNFQVGIGSINTATNAPAGSDPAPAAAAALATWRPGQTIWVTNSLPYARVAEFGLYGKPPGSANGPKTRGGYSREAQGGFVRLTAQDFAQSFRRAARAAKK